jgi:hypothetical protein
MDVGTMGNRDDLLSKANPIYGPMSLKLNLVVQDGTICNNPKCAKTQKPA